MDILIDKISSFGWVGGWVGRWLVDLLLNLLILHKRSLSDRIYILTFYSSGKSSKHLTRRFLKRSKT